MKRFLTLLIALLLLLGCMPVCAWAAEDTDAGDPTELDYYADKRIGILAGSIHETLAAGKYPNAELSFYNAYSDMAAALNAHQIDAFYASHGNAVSIAENLTGLTYLEEPLAAMPCAIAFGKNEDGEALAAQFNEFLAAMRADGSLDALVAEWMSPTLTPASVDFSDLPTDGRVLEFATTGQSNPYSMLVNGEPSGLDVDLAVRFCREFGYGIHINLMDWPADIPGLTTGLYDFAGDCFFVSEERKGSVNFSDTCYETPIFLVVEKPAGLPQEDPLSLDSYAEKRIGVVSGSVDERIAERHFPDAEQYYFINESDCCAALTAGQIDAFVASDGSARVLLQSVPTLTRIPEPLDTSTQCTLAFAKTENGDVLCAQMNDFIAGLRADGTLDAIYEKWMEPDALELAVELPEAEDGARVLEFATTGQTPPYSFILNGQSTGLDIELAVLFCREYGYGLHINLMDWASVIPGLASDMYDFAGDCLVITDERRESINLADPCYTTPFYLMVPAPETDAADPSKLAYYADKRIGVLAGSVGSDVVLRRFPHANISFLNTAADLASALTAGQIDVFVENAATIDNVCHEQPSIVRLEEDLDEASCALAFSKNQDGEQLCAQFNEFIAGMKADGSLDELTEQWYTPEALESAVDISDLPTDGRVLEFATTGQTAPYSFILDTQPTGLDIDLAVRFCREFGYGIHINLMDWYAVLPGLSSGLYDFGGDCLVITEERRESACLSEPCYTIPYAMAVLAPDTAAVTTDSDDPSELSYYAHKRIGVIGGSIHEDVVAENFPEAKASYYTNNSDMAVALQSGLIDCFTTGIQGAEEICKNVEGLTWLDMPLGTLDIGMAFAKTEDGKELCEQFNDYIASLRADGSYDELMANWCGDDAPMVPVDTSGLPTDGRIVEFATTGLCPPYSCIIDGEPNGFDVDLAVHFCREYGYGINISITEVASMMPGLTSGIYDMLGNCLVITPERLESAYMSDATYDTALVLVVNADTLNAAAQDAEPETFWEKLSLSFEKTFIREQRWKMIVNGLGTTILISVLSVVFGSILGFGICMLRRTGSKTAIGFSVVFTRLLQGTPIVVLLMILFYIVFARTGLNAVAVAVVGFSLNFAAYVCEILRTGIEAVPVGQTEAALASGYTKPQAFFSIVMPQAAINFLPVYRGEIVSLVKSTSVVGYIAIQDLTKAGDLIRSRTYEPFFPLIVTAVIYFTLSWLLGFLLMRLESKFKPNRKKRTVKGVKLP